MPSTSLKVMDSLLNEQNEEVKISGSLVLDKISGKTLSEHIADANAHPNATNVNQAIQDALAPIQSTLNNFMTGDPDDNGTIDRLRELVQAINSNKDNIQALMDAAGTGIAFIADASDTPVYDAKVRMVVSDYTPPVQSGQD